MMTQLTDRRGRACRPAPKMHGTDAVTSFDDNRQDPVGFLVAIEGIDGCGKTTLVGRVARALEQRGQVVTRLSFPDYDEPVAGHLIARFLRGELAESRLTPPWMLALLFALNRATKRREIQAALAAGHAVLCDRYVYSNAAFQGAKLAETESLDEFLVWLETVEFDIHRAPPPRISIWIDLPFSNLPPSGTGREDRSYLRGARDVHEADDDLQARVAGVYAMLAASRDDFTRLDACARGRRATADELAEAVLRLIEPSRTAA